MFAPQDEYLPVIKTALSSGETVPLGQGMRINARPKQRAVTKLQVDKVSWMNTSNGKQALIKKINKTESVV